MRYAKGVVVDIGLVEFFELSGIVIIFEVDAIPLIVECLESLLKLIAFLPVSIDII